MTYILKQCLIVQRLHAIFAIKKISHPQIFYFCFVTLSLPCVNLHKETGYKVYRLYTALFQRILAIRNGKCLSVDCVSVDCPMTRNVRWRLSDPVPTQERRQEQVGSSGRSSCRVAPLTTSQRMKPKFLATDVATQLAMAKLRNINLSRNTCGNLNRTERTR